MCSPLCHHNRLLDEVQLHVHREILSIGFHDSTARRKTAGHEQSPVHIHMGLQIWLLALIEVHSYPAELITLWQDPNSFHCTYLHTISGHGLLKIFVLKHIQKVNCVRVATNTRFAPQYSCIPLTWNSHRASKPRLLLNRFKHKSVN